MKKSLRISIGKRGFTVYRSNVEPKTIQQHQFVPKNMYQRLVHYVFCPMTQGQLTMTMPDGQRVVYGNGQGRVSADMTVHDEHFFKRCVLYGDVGFGESYVDGEWSSDDLTAVIEWMILNIDHHPTLMQDKKKRSMINWLKTLNNLKSVFRKNSRRGSRRNIYAHYDLGNDFYALFLDPSMTYSSAYFKYASQSLEEAQYAKYERLCEQIKLTEHDHVLEIGSGWGGFAIYAAKNYGCRVTTITISQEQFRFAQQRIQEEALDDRITIELKDYRDVTGQFDKIVSIEMLEAVGHEYYDVYFKQCHRLLKREGVLAVQVILSPDHRYDSFRENMDWIQKHIFPGSLLPSMSAIQQSIQRTGDLCLYDYKDLTMHYAKTLSLWCDRFNQHYDHIKALGPDDVFMRKWNYYWRYCEAAFKTRNISVAQIVFTRANNQTLCESV